jgi:hypothetical protein
MDSLQYFICDTCSKIFLYKAHIERHMSVHLKNHNVKHKFVYQCPLCNFSVENKQLLFNHFNLVHKIILTIQKTSFENVESFHAWKSEYCTETNSEYKLNATNKLKNGNKNCFYQCSRSGFHSSEGNNIRRIKTKGSIKIGRYCPAKITAQINVNQKVDVEYLNTHIGHEQNLRHLKLTKHDRDNLANKIKLKIPFRHILEDIREPTNVDECRKVTRRHLVTKKDLHNIKKSYKLDDTKFHQDDAVSVDAWVEKLGDTVKLYKPVNKSLIGM